VCSELTAPARYTRDVIDHVTNGAASVARIVRRHPSYFRPEASTLGFAGKRVDLREPGQRYDSAASALVIQRVGRGNNPFVHPVRFPW
jgi:hypothetical protein